MTTAHSSRRGAWSDHGLLLAAACNLNGWLLSIPGWLKPFPMLLGMLLWWLVLARLCGVSLPGKPNFRSWKWRGRHLLPLGFLLIAALALAGGILHPPNNMDAMNYRMPRVLNWLAEGRWHWIESNNNALNTRSSGFEWLMAPIFALLRSDKPLFLLNFLSFLCLPAYGFCFLRGIGLGRRVAWSWMWLLPSGYCFALQAGSIGNDLPAAVACVAAFAYAFAWRKRGGHRPLLLCLLAAGMMTAIKPTTLPLGLPLLAVLAPSLASIWNHRVRLAGLLPLAALASFLPNAVINLKRCGDWTGARAENSALGEVEPLIGLLGNPLNLAIQNLSPPVFPLASRWNHAVNEWMPQRFLDSMARSFEASGARFTLPDIQGEEWAGLGAGLSWLVLVSLALALPHSLRTSTARSVTSFQLWLIALFVVATLAYFAKAGMTTVGRHMSPFYIPWIACCFLVLPQQRVIRTRLWNALAAVAMLSTIVMLVLSPSRPLFPSAWVFAKLESSMASPVIRKAAAGYEVYRNRADSLGSLRDALPDTARTIAYMNYFTGPELPLWKPYGTRRVIHVPPGASRQWWDTQRVSHAVLSVRGFNEAFGMEPERWLESMGGRILFREHLQLLAKETPSEWWTIELPARSPSPTRE